MSLKGTRLPKVLRPVCRMCAPAFLSACESSCSSSGFMLVKQQGALLSSNTLRARAQLASSSQPTGQGDACVDRQGQHSSAQFANGNCCSRSAT